MVEINVLCIFLQSLRNNKTYVGFTSKDPKERLKEHNYGTNKFTSNNRPWELVYYETFTCKNCAREREKFFKTGIGKKLKKIILENFKKS